MCRRIGKAVGEVQGKDSFEIKKVVDNLVYKK